MDESLMSVSRFAALAGLTAHALRHYDAVGLLRPAEVDERTGYRRYSPSQLPTARLVKDLRWLDLPLQQVRQVVADPTSDGARTLLAAHGERLRRERLLLERRIRRLDDHATTGVLMNPTPTATAPVQLKLGVEDLDRARRFYDDALGLAESVIRHTDDGDFGGYQFGTYGQPGFFLLVLCDPEDFDRPGRSTFGLSVPDLDESHARALAAGGEEAVAISTPEGMPRCSAVTDPDGNWIWLYQA